MMMMPTAMPRPSLRGQASLPHATHPFTSHPHGHHGAQPSTGAPSGADLGGSARRHCERGDLVFPSGTPVMPSLIVRGACRIDRPGADDDDLQLALPGDLLGLEALHAWSPRGTVRALVDTVVMPLRRLSDAEWRDLLLHALLRRQAQGASLARVRAGTASERVRRVLLLLAGVDDHADPTAQDECSLPDCELPSLLDLSALTATAPETVSRVVSSMRRAGLITDTGPRRVRLGAGLLLTAGELPGGMTRSRVAP
jgi:CRP-like cAMP-binding protein